MALIVQLAFWEPHREIAGDFTAAERRRMRAESAAQFIAAVLAALTQRGSAPSEMVNVTPGAYACTYPGCSRGAANPLPSAQQLANHRYAAHGIRSTNDESIARQARRDRRRAELTGAVAPEYIDAEAIRRNVRQRFPIALPRGVREGALDPGEREALRRRLCHLVTTLPREIKREPAEIALAVAELAATGFAPPTLKLSPQRNDVTMARLESLFTKRTTAEVLAQ